MAETVGSLVDKLSILELKIYHMDEQVQRADATPEHKNKCLQRLTILKEQQTDLSAELSGLFDHVLAGKKQLKVYRQFKMYNDPVYRSQTTK